MTGTIRLCNKIPRQRADLVGDKQFAAALATAGAAQDEDARASGAI